MSQDQTPSDPERSVDDRREELDADRETVRAATNDSEESPTNTGGFEFPAASQ